jgi:hypothetical protein
MASIPTQRRRRLTREERELLRKLVSDALREQNALKREGWHNRVRR